MTRKYRIELVDVSSQTLAQRETNKFPTFRRVQEYFAEEIMKKGDKVRIWKNVGKTSFSQLKEAEGPSWRHVEDWQIVIDEITGVPCLMLGKEHSITGDLLGGGE